MSNAEDEPLDSSIPLLPPDAANFAYIHTNETRGLRSRGNIVAGETMPCECRHLSQAKNSDPASEACGEDSGCINRMLLVECDQSCPAGQSCQNKRFQQRKYAKIQVVDTPGKGFGLMAKEDLVPGQFAIEYVGEVLSHHAFVKRSLKYSEEGASHFYFMTLTADEIIDASQKGNISRFMNHSCDPNCETQKWIVGKQMRIGLFALKHISRGAELTFDYKFERFGDQAQPCRCGEANCKGMIGSQRRSPGEQADYDDDEPDIQAKKGSHKLRSLSLAHKRELANGLDDPNDVQKIVKTMLRTEKTDTLLRQLRILNATTLVPCLRKFLHLHGLKILHALLAQYENEPSVVYFALCLLKRLPVATRNSVEDSNLPTLVSQLAGHEESRIAELANAILQTWQGLAMVYKIPKVGTPVPDASPDSGSSETESSSAAGLASRSESKGPPTGHDWAAESAALDPGPSSDPKRMAAAPIETLVDKADKARQDYFDELSTRIPESLARSRFHVSHAMLTLHHGQHGEDRHVETKRSRRCDDDHHDDRAHKRDHREQAFSGIRCHVDSKEDLRRAKGKEKDHFAPCVSQSDFDSQLDSLGHALPVDWRAAADDQGRIYYFNVNTRATQWDIPVSEETSSAPKSRITTTGSEGLSSQAIQEVIERAKSLVREREQKEAEAAYSAKERTARLKDQVSDIVIKFLSKFKAQFASSEEFKRHARKLTHALLEKEQKVRQSHPQSVLDYLDKTAKRKMKIYLSGYLAKLGYKKPDETCVKKDRQKSKKA